MEQIDDKQRLAQLEARARMLEAELIGLNATIATLRARLSTSYAQPTFAPVGIPSVPVPQHFKASTPQPLPASIPSVPMPPNYGMPNPPPPVESQQESVGGAAVPSELPVAQEVRSPQEVSAEEAPLPVAWAPAPSETPQEVPAEAAPAEGIYLSPLPPYDSLRRKWDIGTGESPAEPVGNLPLAAVAESPTEQQQPAYTAEPELRLFGLLSDGSPWEYRIPFSCMATEEGIYIGRDAEYAQVILDDASVSRCHLRMELTEQGIVVTDMNSTNGSVINDHVITEYENRLPLNDGDTLTLGNVTLQAQFLQ